MNETIILLILLAIVVFVFFYLIWEINVCLNTFIYARQKKKMFKSLEENVGVRPREVHLTQLLKNCVLNKQTEKPLFI